MSGEILLNCKGEVGKILIREYLLVSPLHELDEEGAIYGGASANVVAGYRKF
ncbi:hypothetical protein DSM107003_12870 [Trichormus variabilis SAG 1403-4b]|uniref:Uncharacterized protein n=1 Tax=Trichormus variabilis SAG 1403-4b TaxID=447716 RepID=A0A433UWJ9_ANAVA|nr:hypothetical protein DSM107003_12870 [Trichormus variabilis SAG 1403-4b]